MTRDEAARILSEFRECTHGRAQEAFDIAIEALQQPTHIDTNSGYECKPFLFPNFRTVFDDNEDEIPPVNEATGHDVR